mmetsp:Transcript_21569/g.59926  ORF Transcript_21569/g.59926 Transcript_21569/m.59926 type:complete len:132 (+) Transcript_21569:2052-2447(+)
MNEYASRVITCMPAQLPGCLPPCLHPSNAKGDIDDAFVRRIPSHSIPSCPVSLHRIHFISPSKKQNKTKRNETKQNKTERRCRRTHITIILWFPHHWKPTLQVGSDATPITTGTKQQRSNEWFENGDKDRA